MDPQHFKNGLLHGDPNIIYPVLAWMLQRRPELTTRAYLARFLVSVEIPEHMFGDEQILEVYQQYKDLQEEFKEVHRSSERSKSQLISPAEIKKAIVQMEEDKEQLERKVEALHAKLSGSNNFDGMLREAGALRIEQDEQLKLQDRMREQRGHAYQAEQRLEQLKRALTDKRAEASTSDIRALLRKLEGEVAALSRRANEELPRAIAAKQQRHDELQQVLTMPIGSDSDMRTMMGHRQQLQRSVGALEERKRALASNPDDKLAMFRQQANLVAKKREQVQARLEAVSRDRAVVENELASRATEVAALTDKPVLRGDDFRKYANEVRGRTAQYKRMKQELGELRGEWGLLSRTLAVLAEQEKGVSRKLSDAERKRGVSGFAQTEEQLQKVSQQKAEVDSVKGKTLEEISQVVEEINTQIKEKKNRLAPQIKNLRSLRTRFGEVEVEYLDKKAAYDNTKAGFDSETSKLQAELDEADKDAQHEESSCHYYQTLASMERIKLQRVADEKAGRSLPRTGPDDSTITTYKALYERKIREQEGQQRTLRDQQKSLKENHEPNKVQMQLFRDLNKLLRCKVDMQKAARTEAAYMAAAEEQDSNVLSLGDD
jgi:intraflagellar transport protein 81